MYITHSSSHYHTDNVKKLNKVRKFLEGGNIPLEEWDCPLSVPLPKTATIVMGLVSQSCNALLSEEVDDVILNYASR